MKYKIFFTILICNATINAMEQPILTTKTLSDAQQQAQQTAETSLTTTQAPGASYDSLGEINHLSNAVSLNILAHQDPMSRALETSIISADGSSGGGIGDGVGSNGGCCDGCNCDCGNGCDCDGCTIL